MAWVMREESRVDALMAYNSAKNGLNGLASSGSSRMPPIPPMPRIDTTPQDQQMAGQPIFYRENERHYDAFRRGRYKLPCDEEEMDRLDMVHKVLQIARIDDSTYGTLHRLPLPVCPRILDLGCGTGIWAIDIAERFGRSDAPAEVVGWDLALIQPKLIPPNSRFERRDIEDRWTGVNRDYFDLIHVQMLLGSISNWHALYRQIFEHLKPGSGILEQVEIDIRPFIDEGGFPESSKFLLWVREMNEAHDRAGQPLGMDPNTQAVLEHLGYVDVRHDEIKVPYNSWPAGDHERDLGKWFNLAMTQGLSAMSLAPLTRMLGYKKDQVDALLEEVKEEICDRSIKSYCIMHIWTARRPAGVGRP